MGERRKFQQKKLTHGCTTLMYACQNGLTSKVINEIRNKPQSLYKKDRHNKSALHYCTGNKRLLSSAASVMISAPELLDAEDEDGFTPLHLAVIQGNTGLVNLLLSQNVNVNALDNEGHSVVHWAVVCGEIDALKACLTAGADIGLADKNGASPLHFAAQICGANYEGKSDKASIKLALEILDILLQQPSMKVDVDDKDGRTPLLWAASAGSEKAVLQLIKAGAKLESSDKDGLTALHCAASKGHTSVIDALVKLCGCDVDLIDSNGCSALHYATTLGHADAVSLLLDLGADPNRSDRKGRTPAHCGCNKGQLETIKIIGSRKGNLWLRNAKGDLPIHEACQSGRKELVKWLLELKPIHVNTVNTDGKSLLHIAASNDNVDLCKMLLDFGAEINSIYRTPSNVVLTPLDVCVQKGYRNTAKFLQSVSGLPAHKLKITGKRPSVSAGSTDSDQLIKPGKFVEKEELYDLKKSKKYVVYVKRSDSISDDEHFRGRLKARACSHHRRRTKSCSGANQRRVKCCRVRKKHHMHQNSDSSDEMSSDFDEECCSDCCFSDESSISRSKSHQIICEYKKKRKKKKDKCSKHIETKGSADSDSDADKNDKPKDTLKKDQPVTALKGCSHDDDTNKTGTVTSASNKKRPPSAKSSTLPKRKSKISEAEPGKTKEITTKAAPADAVVKEVTFAPMPDKAEHVSDVEGAISDGTFTIESKIDSAPEDKKISKRAPPRELVKKESAFIMLDDKDIDVEKINTSETVQQQQQQPQQHAEEQAELKPDDEDDKEPGLVVNVNIKYEEKASTEDKSLPEGQADADTSPESKVVDAEKSKDESEVEKTKADFTRVDSTGSKQSKQSFQVIDDSQDDFDKLDTKGYLKSKLEAQGSKEEDSGFEPSPRSVRASRKKFSSAVLPHDAPTIYANRGLSSRQYNYLFGDEKRKPGDKNAVNMKTVSKSIQKNMKRYYMEKKIFQQLLELKGLQMRSNKSNEAMVVRRAVDDYHKQIGNDMPTYPFGNDYTFKNFELFLYETLRGLQKRGSYNFQNLSDVYRETERRSSVTDLLRSEKALQCTTKTHRCLHALHSYTGIPCAAYIPLMNHHTIPKLGFGPYKNLRGKFYLPKILTNTKTFTKDATFDADKGNDSQILSLPADSTKQR